MIIDIQRHWGEREIYYAGELSSKIIHGMQTAGYVTLRSKECRSLRTSGLKSLLDQLCYYWQWDKKNIIIETGNVYDTQATDLGYTINLVFRSEPLINTDISCIEHRLWNKEKTYGMFIGRANVTRMRAIYNHQKFEFKEQGLTSFNHDFEYHTDSYYLLDYLCQSDQRFSEIKQIKPYSDIGPVLTPPITLQYGGTNWNNVYEKIGIEIVLETAEDEESVALTEKLSRPILYKRPFILVAGRNSIKNIYKHLGDLGSHILPCELLGGLKFFENVIPLDYDNDGGIERVDHAFDILHTLIRTGKINTILEDCYDDIEHNYQYIINLSKVAKERSEDYNQALDPLSWGKPTYK